MNKEKINESGYDEYQKKLQLIKKLTDDINREFNLKDKDCVISTPDQLVVPIIHEDGERVEHVTGVFKTEKRDDLKIPMQMEKNSAPEGILASDLIKGLLKFGPEFNSEELQLRQKCLEKFKEEQRKQKEKQ